MSGSGIDNTGGANAPTFAVVAMMREDPSIIRRFVDFYSTAGAERIEIFHDGPLPARASLEGPGVTITECDAAFWQALCGGPRPAVHEQAQAAIYNATWKTCESDWLLVVDADEFVFGPIPIREMLKAIPPEVEAIRIPTAEAVWGPGDDIDAEFGCTYFRTPIRRGARLVQRLVYGDLAPLFHMGLLGHNAGKHFVRRAARIDSVRLHNSLKDGQGIGKWAATLTPKGKGFLLAHFDAIGIERWREKWRRRLTGEIKAKDMSSQRRAQMRVIGQGIADGEAALRRTFARLNGLTPWQCFLLRQIGAVTQVNLAGNLSGALAGRQ